MRVKCLAQEHNTMTLPALEPGPLDPKSSALTTRPPIRLYVLSCSYLEFNLPRIIDLLSLVTIVISNFLHDYVKKYLQPWTNRVEKCVKS